MCYRIAQSCCWFAHIFLPLLAMNLLENLKVVPVLILSVLSFFGKETPDESGEPQF
jgi:hypothetical protein